jgi:hypothetical protein
MNIFHVGNLLEEFVNEFDELRKSCSRFVRKNVSKIGPWTKQSSPPWET